MGLVLKDTYSVEPKILKRYIDSEGFELDLYKDTKGLLTGGIGHLMLPTDIKEFKSGWTNEVKQEYWLKKFEEDYTKYKMLALKEVIGFEEEVSMELLEILTELKFNMGPNRFNKNKWPSFFKYIEARDYKKAAYELLHNSSGGPSKWLLDVKGRAIKISDELRGLA